MIAPLLYIAAALAERLLHSVFHLLAIPLGHGGQIQRDLTAKPLDPRQPRQIASQRDTITQ